MNPFLRSLERHPVIAGIKSIEQAPQALEAGVAILFVLAGTIFDLQEMAAAPWRKRALIFAHVDLLQGIGRDAWGMRFLATEIGVDGILTTRTQLIKAAKDEGLYAIQRFFMLDSEAIKTAIQVLKHSQPDAVELLPALILPSIWRRLPLSEFPPIIAGGLVETVEEVNAILQTPAKAVSTSRQALWSAVGVRSRGR